MGCKNSSTGPKNADIEIIIEICESWGYENRVKYVTDYIIKPIKEEGLTLRYTFNPMKGGKGDFFLFKVIDGKNKAIFSNKKDLHPEAIHGMNITSKNSNDIIKKLKEN